MVFLANLVTAVLRTIFVSAILFIITYSVITREFPPSLSKIKKSWAQLQRLTEISKTALTPESRGAGPDEEADVNKLINLQKAKAVAFGEEDENISQLKASNQKLSEELKSLQREVLFANQKILGLQDRLDALEKQRAR